MYVDPRPTIVPVGPRATAPRPGRPVIGQAATTARWVRSLTTDAPMVEVRGVGAGVYPVGVLESRAVNGETWAEAVIRAVTGR